MAYIVRKFCTLICCLLAISACQKTQVNIPKTPLQEVTEIAIFLPLTLADGKLGRECNELIKLGIADGLQSARINITTYDIADEQLASVAVEKALKHNTKIILGPLNSKMTKFISEKIRGTNIIIISLSNDPVIAGDNVYIFGHAPLKQLSVIMSYLINNNEKNFISLMPEGNYSMNVAKFLEDIAIRHNATLIASKFYKNTPESISANIEYIASEVDKINEMEDVSNKPAIYLAGDQHSLSMIFDNIRKHHLDKKAIIFGDNRLDNTYDKNLDILFTGTLNILNTNLQQEIRKLEVENISLIHALAYDLGKITAHNIAGEFTLEKFIGNISTALPYNGVSGHIYFIDNIAQRGYDIIKRVKGEYHTIEIQAK